MNYEDQVETLTSEHTFDGYEDTTLKIDMEAEAAYLSITSKFDQLFTTQHNDSVMVDFNWDGNLVGIELLNLEEGYPLNELATPGSSLYLLLEQANEIIRISNN